MLGETKYQISNNQSSITNKKGKAMGIDHRFSFKKQQKLPDELCFSPKNQNTLHTISPKIKIER